jgi:hypothetical protein
MIWSRRTFVTVAPLVGARIAAPAEAATRGTARQLIHQVYFWLKNPQSKSDVARLIAGLRTLRDIPTVRELHIGTPAATEQGGGVDSSYKVSLLAFFDSFVDEKAYEEHPLHQQFLRDCSHLLAKGSVFNSMDV